jgi:formamidopyrimidine-DNA glycosylase
MPEIPDIEAYLEALRSRVVGERLLGLRLAHPFLLRTACPLPEQAEGREVLGVSRLGKRLVFELEEELFLVMHLMIAGRLHWKPPAAAIPRGRGLAAFDFAGGSLILTEAGSKRRASLHILQGREALAGLDPGGLEVFQAGPGDLEAALTRQNHTLKRALTDPHILSGIGNAYSDEILHRARLSPFKLTQTLSPEELTRLRDSIVAVLREWTERLREEAREAFPEKVTAFRSGMAVHGRFRQPCPVCGTSIQRIAYADNEANYCPVCQTEGRLLADRALSRLLKGDWPKTVEELESRGAKGKV